MKIKLFLDKSIEENAALYFEKAKKLKRKVEGARISLHKHYLKLTDLEKKQEKKKKKEQEKEEKVKRKKEWYEKFRWFYSSEGFLVIGGRDATTNEIVIKKHTDKEDIVFHASMSGSPFFVIKTEGKKPGKATLEETAQATASYSRAWRLGLASSEVFYVNPDQVTKEAKSGEFMPKGSFMVYGKKNILRPDIKVAIGLKDSQIIGGPVNAVKKHTQLNVTIIQGREKASAIAKKIISKFKDGDLDDVIRFLPSGGVKIS